MGNRFQEEKGMKCVVCKMGETTLGETTVTLERGKMTLVLKRVPAQICQNCGEAYLDERTTSQILHLADATAQAGVQVDVREFILAEPAKVG
jgi:YgiT-type zinc finger domain-containing protein